LLDKVKQLIHEGNVRKVTVKQGERVLAEFPLTLGVAAAVIAPVLAAIGAIAALVTSARSRWSGRTQPRRRTSRLTQTSERSLAVAVL